MVDTNPSRLVFANHNDTRNRILITGGAGFIGSHLVRYIRQNSSSDIAILDNLHRVQKTVLDELLSLDGIQFIEGDIRDQEMLAQVMPDTDVVFHLAAQSNVIGAEKDIDYSFSTNVIGTFNVLKACRENKVARVVITSSREVYGDVDSLPVNETTPLRGKNAYGASKVAGEQYCDLFRESYGVDIRVVRLTNVYGSGDEDRVIPLFCKAANHGKPLIVYGGEQVLDFIWIGDVVRALWDVANLPNWSGQMNIGGGQGISIFDLAKKIQEITAIPASQIEIYPRREFEVKKFVADISNMRSTLGWSPELPSLRHLPEVLTYYK
jgi:nucleoside-diphosphate-sugar epimerase